VGRLFYMTGFLGALTAFSTFALETVTYGEAGRRRARRLLTFCESWAQPLPLVVVARYSSPTCTSNKEITVARTRTTPTFSAAKYVDYIRDLVDATQAGTGSSREFVERHARALGGYASYLLHLPDVPLAESFCDALRARQNEWPLTFTGYRVAFPPHLTERLVGGLEEALGLWRIALGTDDERAAQANVRVLRPGNSPIPA
jgi:hypothetical protein